MRPTLLLVILVSSCGGSQPPSPKTQAEAFCASAAIPLPDSAPKEAQELHAAALQLCAANRALEQSDGGAP